VNRLLAISIIVLCLAFAADGVQAAPPSPYTNILANGNFSSSFSSWSTLGNTVWDVTSGVMEVYVPTSPGNITQTTSYSASAGDRYEVRLELGNSSNVSKSVTVVLSENDFTKQVACTFVLPANSPLRPYRVRGLTPAGGWANIRFFINFNTFDSLPAVQIDNVVAEYVPGAQFSSTICTPPATPTPTFTPSPTHTPTPDIFAYSTVIAPGQSEGREVAVSFVVSAGEVMTVTLLLLIFAMLVLWFIYRLRRG
jgi:hypothetical protein